MVAMANAVKIAIIPLAVPVVFLFLEVLFGSIQALVFALLTAIYIVLAAGGHEEEDHDAGHADAHAVPAGCGQPRRLVSGATRRRDLRAGTDTQDRVIDPHQ